MFKAFLTMDIVINYSYNKNIKWINMRIYDISMYNRYIIKYGGINI